MPALICFGLGYTAEHFIAAFGDRFDRITGTVRGIERANDLNGRFGGRVKVLAFDGKSASAEAKAAAAENQTRDEGTDQPISKGGLIIALFVLFAIFRVFQQGWRGGQQRISPRLACFFVEVPF